MAAEDHGKPGPTHTDRQIPWALLLASVVVVDGAVAFTEYTAEFPETSIGQRLYATVVMFAGTYTNLGDKTEPSTSLSVVGTIAVVSTFVAIGSALLAAFSSAKRWLRALGASPMVVVIGSGVQAAKIIESCHKERTPAVLIAESALSPAALKAGPTLVLFASATAEQFNDADHLPRAVRSVLKKTRKVIVATDSDGTNVAVQQRINKLGSHRSWAVHDDEDDNAVFALVQSGELADALRGNEVKAEHLRSEIACPDENLAEHITQLLKSVTGLAESPDVPAIIAVRLEVVTDDAETAATAAVLQRWLTNMVWSLQRLKAGLEHNLPAGVSYNTVPQIELTDDPAAAHIVIALGEPSATAAWALRQAPHTGPRLMIVTSSPELLRATSRDDEGSSTCFESWYWLEALRHRRVAETNGPGGEGAPARFTWGEIVVVDADAVRFDHRLMADGRVTAWARAYHQAYSVMVGVMKHGGNAGPWVPRTHPDREQQSSMTAVLNMIRFLDSKGYVLSRADPVSGPCEFVIADQDRDDIAAREHDDWMARRYKVWRSETSNTVKARKKTSAGRRLEDTSWADLDAAARDYNQRVVTAVFPYVAALLGYEIRHVGHRDQIA